MRMLLALLVFGIGLGAGMFLDLVLHVPAPPLYWFIGVVTDTSVLALATADLKE